MFITGPYLVPKPFLSLPTTPTFRHFEKRLFDASSTSSADMLSAQLRCSIDVHAATLAVSLTPVPRLVALIRNVLWMVTRAKHHEHIPSLTLKERELERLKRERERKEGGLTGESDVGCDDLLQCAKRCSVECKTMKPAHRTCRARGLDRVTRTFFGLCGGRPILAAFAAAWSMRPIVHVPLARLKPGGCPSPSIASCLYGHRGQPGGNRGLRQRAARTGCG